jgi:uncharacterized protein YdeI (YjbR/CyaY-like superfamily)
MEIISFRTAIEFRRWLERNHRESPGIRLRIFKKGSRVASITYAEALDEALCFGWIDGQKEPHDETSWGQRFSRRRARSGWSKINTQHAERLMAAKRMQPAGLLEVEAAKKDGRWQAAYDSPKTATVPPDFLAELRKDERALAFFESLNRANQYAIAYRLQTAKKPETRAKRLHAFVEMMKKGEKLH